MSEKKSSSMSTIILFIVVLPVVGYLLNFAYKKNTESEERANLCMQECTAQGYPGHEFKWNVMSGPQCACFGEQQLIQ